MNQHKKFVVGGAATLAAVVAIAGIAFALWSSTGSGWGTARATTAVDAIVNPSDGDPDLYPGFTEGDVTFTVTNDNAYPIEYTSMTAGLVTSSDEVACPASNVTVEGATGLALTAPPETTSGQLAITDVVSMDSAAPDGCQGASFDIELVLTGDQAS